MKILYLDLASFPDLQRTQAQQVYVALFAIKRLHRHDKQKLGSMTVSEKNTPPTAVIRRQTHVYCLLSEFFGEIHYRLSA